MSVLLCFGLPLLAAYYFGFIWLIGSARPKGRKTAFTATDQELADSAPVRMTDDEIAIADELDLL